MAIIKKYEDQVLSPLLQSNETDFPVCYKGSITLGSLEQVRFFSRVRISSIMDIHPNLHGISFYPLDEVCDLRKVIFSKSQFIYIFVINQDTESTYNFITFMS